MSEQVKKKDSDSGWDKVIVAILAMFMVLIWHYLKIVWIGIRRYGIIKNVYFWSHMAIGSLVVLNVVWPKPYLILFFHSYLKAHGFTFLEGLIKGYNPIPYYIVFFFIYITIPYFIYGLGIYQKKNKYQKAIDNLGFKNGSGKPRVVDVLDLGDTREKVIIQSDGFGSSRFESKKDDLQTSFQKVIEEIKVGKRQNVLEVYLSEREIPQKCLYTDLIEEVQTPYSFLIGQGRKGMLAQSIRSLPHLMVAGTTGGGKSVFMNNLICGLLRTSPADKLVMYLFDFKRGLEVKQYEDFNNVTVVKEERKAAKILEDLNEMMNNRFDYLEKNKKKEIDPEKDKFPIIVVAIDEASEIYDNSTKNKDKKELVERMRESTHRLVKLGRASGIHLCFLTQKIKKEVLDTKIQANIGGRMCFKVATISDSNTVLNNKLAYHLPAHQGRGIWHRGNEFIEVQAPYLSENDLKEECKVLKVKFDSVNNKAGANITEVDPGELDDPEEEKSIAA